MRLLFCLALLSACLSGCGQTGPLYLPEEAPAAASEAPAATGEAPSAGADESPASVPNPPPTK
jgi:predicted small lipoprotein YifL